MTCACMNIVLTKFKSNSCTMCLMFLCLSTKISSSLSKLEVCTTDINMQVNVILISSFQCVLPTYTCMFPDDPLPNVGDESCSQYDDYLPTQTYTLYM